MIRSLPLARLRGHGIPVEDGLAFFRWVQWWRPLEITSDDAVGYRSPWSVAAHWDPTDRRWEIQIHRDSYLSGATVREVESPALRWDYLPRATRTRYAEQDPGGLVVPWLSEEPWQPVTAFRRLGADADPALAGSAEPIPAPLIALGAGEADTITADRDQLTLTTSLGGTPDERARRRLVRAADIVLHVERERVRLDTPGDGSIQIEIDPPRRSRPWVTISPARFLPAAEVGSIAEQFAAALDDTGVDELLVARLYLLSPPGARAGSEPDRTWQPHVERFLFWNPQHRTNREINIVEPLNLSFPTGLAGGAGDGLISATLADINLKDALASALVSRARVRGVFFT